MKVIAINGSPRKEGNTFTALNIMAEELKKEGIDTEIIHVGKEQMHGCIGCGYCYKSENNHCVFKDDITNEVTDKMRTADGIILGSPTYFGGVAGAFKCFLDRAFYSSYAKVDFRNKVCTAVAVARRSGGVEVYNQLCNYFHLVEAVIPPSQYWVLAHGADEGEILEDHEGIQIIRRNANAMAWQLKMINATKDSIALPYVEKKARTNFIE